MFPLFGILDPSKRARSGDRAQKPFFGGPDPADRITRAERELALLSTDYPLAIMPPEDDDGDPDARKLRFVSLFASRGV
jgi:hypothetical protein